MMNGLSLSTIPLSVIFDVFLIATLLVAIIYAYRLHKQIRLLRAGKKELNDALKLFIAQSNRAELAIQEMQKNASKSTEQLEMLMHQGEPLKHELASLIKQAEGAFKRLDSQRQMHKYSSQNKATTSPKATNTKATKADTARPRASIPSRPQDINRYDHQSRPHGYAPFEQDKGYQTPRASHNIVNETINKPSGKNTLLKSLQSLK